MTFLVIYLISINLISCITCIVDKVCAIRGGWRVKERDLLLLCFLGGSAAMYFTMCIIRHKTRKNKFMIGIPIILILQVAALLYFLHTNSFEILVN